jgi:parallel beta-helix repeat protein
MCLGGPTLRQLKYQTFILVLLIITASFSILILFSEKTSAYTPHAPIYINGNNNFTAPNGVTAGSGIPSDPYIIEGWDIDAFTADGIEIHNTNAYFIIRDVYIHDGMGNGLGIHLDNVTNGIIEQSIITNNYHGIYFFSSSNITVINNNVSLNVRHGINYFYSYRINITNNTIHGDTTSWSGIYSRFSTENIINENNISSFGWDGIHLYYSNNSNISDNTILFSEDQGIYISESPNSTICRNNISSSGEEGIFLIVSDNTTISDNVISNFKYGISTELSSILKILGNEIHSNSVIGIKLLANMNSGITNNNVSNNNYGISIQHYSNNITVSHNDLHFNDDICIGIGTGSNISIRENNMSHSFGGIYPSKASYIEIEQNNISYNDFGVYIRLSTNITIIDNDFTKDGVTFWGDTLRHFNSHTITTDNLVNGNPIYYYKDSSEVNLDGIPCGQLLLANVTNVTAVNLRINYTDMGIQCGFVDNAFIGGNEISDIHYYGGIYLAYSSNFTIKDNKVFSIYQNGIYPSYCNNITIIGNNVSNNDHGIKPFVSTNISILDNFVCNNSYGIYPRSSYNVIICNNSVSKNDYGINTVDCENVTINDNRVFLNQGSYSWEGHGIRPSSCKNVTIKNNNVTANEGYGINPVFSNNITIAKNIVSRNNYGIYVQSSQNILIYHNNILNNTNQAFDDSADVNSWDCGYPKGGNYWSDYSGIDLLKGPNQDILGSDGIGDTNYSIDSDSIDNYPLMDLFTSISFENYSTLVQGWNLISIPLIQENQDVETVLEMIEGYYDATQWFNPTDSTDPWKHNKVDKPYGNDLFELNETMGFWIHIINPKDTVFLYNGTPPTSNQTITLHPGWNMVGYPSLKNYNRTDGLNNLTFGNEVDAIWSYNASSQKWIKMSESDYFELRKGYYIHAKTECEWEVPF